MNKAHTVQSIIDITKEDHVKMKKIQDALKGQKIYETPPETPEVCTFTMWLRDENNNLKEILGSLFYGNLEKLHAE